jgi:hypothetical protein
MLLPKPVRTVMVELPVGKEMPLSAPITQKYYLQRAHRAICELETGHTISIKITGKRKTFTKRPDCHNQEANPETQPTFVFI